MGSPGDSVKCDESGDAVCTVYSSPGGPHITDPPAGVSNACTSGVGANFSARAISSHPHLPADFRPKDSQP